MNDFRARIRDSIALPVLFAAREKAVAKIHKSGVKVIKQFHQLKLYAAFQSPK